MFYKSLICVKNVKILYEQIQQEFRFCIKKHFLEHAHVCSKKLKQPIRRADIMRNLLHDSDDYK